MVAFHIKMNPYSNGELSSLATLLESSVIACQSPSQKLCRTAFAHACMMLCQYGHSLVNSSCAEHWMLNCTVPDSCALGCRCIANVHAGIAISPDSCWVQIQGQGPSRLIRQALCPSIQVQTWNLMSILAFRKRCKGSTSWCAPLPLPPTRIVPIHLKSCSPLHKHRLDSPGFLCT